MTAKMRLFLLAFLALSLALPALAEDAPRELGLDLVPWSKKLGDRRYESPRDYEGTVKFFRDKWKSSKPVKWSREVSLPAVKYIHVESMIDATKWSGVNIYQLPDGRVRYFVLDRAPFPPAASAAPNKP
jgi:hypothetical protein